MPNFVDLSDKIFGRLFVEERKETRRKAVFWICLCSCGKRTNVRSDYLTRGVQLSCGCLQKEITKKRLTKHGLSKTRAYNIWAGMMKRCYRLTSNRYIYYGARGIVVCERWHTFELFVEDMGQPPTRRHTLDRKNNDGNYEPNNCRWATAKQQANNRRNRRSN